TRITGSGVLAPGWGGSGVDLIGASTWAVSDDGTVWGFGMEAYQYCYPDEPVCIYCTAVTATRPETDGSFIAGWEPPGRQIFTSDGAHVGEILSARGYSGGVSILGSFSYSRNPDDRSFYFGHALPDGTCLLHGVGSTSEFFNLN